MCSKSYEEHVTKIWFLGGLGLSILKRILLVFYTSAFRDQALFLCRCCNSWIIEKSKMSVWAGKYSNNWWVSWLSRRLQNSKYWILAGKCSNSRAQQVIFWEARTQLGRPERARTWEIQQFNVPVTCSSGGPRNINERFPQEIATNQSF